MVSRQAEDGSFEILVDPEDSGASSAGAPGPGKRGKGAIITAVILGAILVVGVTLTQSGDEELAEGEELATIEGTAFRPYVATGQLEEMEEETEEVVEVQARWRPPERKEGPRIVEEGYQGEDLWHLRDVSVQDREPDGVETFQDAQGHPISRREAELRARRELDAIQNADHQFEQRLRRRDAILNSRILQPSAGGGGELVSGMEIDENLRRRIQEEFQARPRPTSFLREPNMPVYEGDEVSYDEIPDSWRRDDDHDR